MPSQTVVYMETTLVAETCWVCGITWAMPWGWVRKQSEQGNCFYCPKGCKLAYGDSEIDKLKAKLSQADNRTHLAQRQLANEQKNHRATKGHVTRQRKRAAAGVCPCCNRTFKQLARHMKTQHPDHTKQ